ncbi:MAG: hypothetical protein HFG22_16565 [Lachnospiraceae bacterium]|nr:hypothetical protein [Lachnospiraceae bacterium]
MIVLYSGTPGSGKSLDCARTIYNWCRRGAPVIVNFPINVDNIRLRRKKDVRFIPNDALDPDMLVGIAREHFAGKKMAEDKLLLIIDEAQLLFNARDWSAKGRDRWNWFFTMHRHFGYFIILCAQFDRMLDRQIRSLIEYEYIHRKVNNMGWKGHLLSCLMLSPVGLFAKVKVWYPMKEKVGCDFYKVSPRYTRLYDTYALLDAPGAREGRGDGAPPDRALGVSPGSVPETPKEGGGGHDGPDVQSALCGPEATVVGPPGADHKKDDMEVA